MSRKNTSRKQTPEGMKWCPRGGGHFAPRTEFAKYTSRADGIAPYCRPHMTAYKRHWVKWTAGEDRRLLEAQKG